PRPLVLRAGYTCRACGAVSSPFSRLAVGMTMRRLALVLLAASLVAFAPAPVPKRPRAEPIPADLKAMRGVWHRVGFTPGGAHINEKARTILAVSSAGRMTYAGGEDEEWTFTLDVHARPPRLDREVVGEASSARLGIYRLAGDSLTLCSSQTSRPVD